jgi:hypothetical protein
MKMTAAEYASHIKDTKLVARNRLEALVKRGLATKHPSQRSVYSSFHGKCKLTDVVEYELLTEETFP